MQKSFSFYKNYELVDSGDARRLERFNDVIIDRPARQALYPKKLSTAIWNKATVVYSDSGWDFRTQELKNIILELGKFKMDLRFTSSGQLGIFPEQIYNWHWLTKLSSNLQLKEPILNCFAYTGGSTLFASQFSELCHLDGSKTAVRWASENLKLNTFITKPVRWVVDDVLTFMRREQKREKKYSGFILDPPAFGRGSGGKIWTLDKGLNELLTLCNELCNSKPELLILSLHEPDFELDVLRDFVLKHFPNISEKNIELLELKIPSSAGNPLHCGVCLRFKNP